MFAVGPTVYWRWDILGRIKQGSCSQKSFLSRGCSKSPVGEPVFPTLGSCEIANLQLFPPLFSSASCWPWLSDIFAKMAPKMKQNDSRHPTSEAYLGMADRARETYGFKIQEKIWAFGLPRLKIEIEWVPVQQTKPWAGFWSPSLDKSLFFIEPPYLQKRGKWTVWSYRKICVA